MKLLVDFYWNFTGRLLFLPDEISLFSVSPAACGASCDTIAKC
jgi:hypothetical protein